jgi:hypothetical protein
MVFSRRLSCCHRLLNPISQQRLAYGSSPFTFWVSLHRQQQPPYDLIRRRTFSTNSLIERFGNNWASASAKVQIAPTNQYDSAVHRIFQVVANIYDAASTNEFASVFRPLFTTNVTGVFLASFTNDNRVSTLDAWLKSNPYGVPDGHCRAQRSAEFQRVHVAHRYSDASENSK